MFFDYFTNKKRTMISEADALKGRDAYAYDVPHTHTVLGTPIQEEPPEKMKEILLGMGCFWGAERLFWKLDGVYTTAVGYAGGYTPYPTYEETCTAQTGHTEVVRVVYDPNVISLEKLLKTFWENHDPTQQMRQGNDIGTQYRSAIYTFDEDQLAAAQKSRDSYQKALEAKGHDEPIATEIAPATKLYYAEPYHQQYLDKNPNGYCALRGTGVACPVPQ